jgi:hypothetical protein
MECIIPGIIPVCYIILLPLPAPIRYSLKYDESSLEKLGFVAYQVKEPDRERLRITLERLIYVPWSLRLATNFCVGFACLLTQSLPKRCRAELDAIVRRTALIRGRAAAAWHVLWHGP